MNDLERYVASEQDPLIKAFKGLYKTAKVASALTNIPLKQAYIEGNVEANLMRDEVATSAVRHLASSGDNQIPTTLYADFGLDDTDDEEDDDFDSLPPFF